MGRRKILGILGAFALIVSLFAGQAQPPPPTDISNIKSNFVYNSSVPRPLEEDSPNFFNEDKLTLEDYWDGFNLDIDSLNDGTATTLPGRNFSNPYKDRNQALTDNFNSNSIKMQWKFQNATRDSGLYIGYNHDASLNFTWIGCNLLPGQNLEFRLPDGWASHTIWFIFYYPNGHESTNNWYRVCFSQPNLNGTKFRITSWFAGNRNVNLLPAVLAQTQYTTWGVVKALWAERSEIARLIDVNAYWAYNPNQPGVIQKMPLFFETGEWYVKDRWIEQYREIAIDSGKNGIELWIRGGR